MAAKQWSSSPALEIDTNKRYRATLETSKGTIVLELFPKQAPLTVNNFVFLARQGFYDGLTFHRYVPGFVIQGGDPTGTGSGGPGYKFKDEPIVEEYIDGTVAMANAGPNTNGSQFFICLGDQRRNLAKSYTIFGRVTEGLEVAHKLRQKDTMNTVSIEEV